MTKIVNIQELYKLIPETARLEGVNFTNLRQLLTSVIETSEASGRFEFVQYIQGNPSLFVVREKPICSTDRLTSEKSTNVPDFSFETTKKGKTKVKISEPISEGDKVEEKSYMSTTSDTKLFPETKMPW
jgi:hypothetical protein